MGYRKIKLDSNDCALVCSDTRSRGQSCHCANLLLMLILRDKNSVLILCIIVVAVFFVQGSTCMRRHLFHSLSFFSLFWKNSQSCSLLGVWEFWRTLHSWCPAVLQFCFFAETYNRCLLRLIRACACGWVLAYSRYRPWPLLSLVISKVEAYWDGDVTVVSVVYRF